MHIKENVVYITTRYEDSLDFLETAKRQGFDTKSWRSTYGYWTVDDGVVHWSRLDGEVNCKVYPWIAPLSVTPTKVIYNGNKTIVLWDDGDKTIVSCGDDEEFDNYTGFLAALAKKLYGSTSRAKKMVRRVTDDQRKPKPQKPQKTQKPQKPQNPVNWLAEIEAEIDKYIEDVTDHQNNYPTRKTHLGGSFI